MPDSNPSDPIEREDPSAPVAGDDAGERGDGGLDDRIGLCLSGGGYRAMIFHVGALWRLHETGILATVGRISSVSGGSITNGVLAMNWPAISATTDRAAFVEHLVDPIRKVARETFDRGSILAGILLPGTVSDRITDAYREHLYGDRTLQDLPDEPRFVFNATNVQTGALWRFSKPYMGDWRVGLVRNPKVELALAVAASSAFPPVLSPAKVEVDPDDFEPGSGTDLQRPPFTEEVVLSDGGVYDNLGLETVWKRCRTILVSDAGGQMEPQGEPKEDWAQHAIRVLDVIDNQVRGLRKRQLVAAYRRGDREGTYWGIRTDIADYGLPDALPVPHARSLELAATKTRLKAMGERRQEALINWGYAVCDAALRRHVRPDLPPPSGFPYPGVET